MTVNKVILVGNLGADPEVRQANSGTTICNLRIATSERVKRGEEWVEETEWHRVVCFGKTAESVGKFLVKGRSVYIEGRIQTRKWQDKETGADRWSTEVVARDVRFLGGGDRSSSGGGSGGGGGGGQAPPSDDIPF